MVLSLPQNLCPACSTAYVIFKVWRDLQRRYVRSLKEARHVEYGLEYDGLRQIRDRR